jgi:hypothetical protein
MWSQTLKVMILLKGDKTRKGLKRLPCLCVANFQLSIQKGKLNYQSLQENTTLHSRIMCLCVHIGLRTKETLGRSAPQKKRFLTSLWSTAVILTLRPVHSTIRV